MIGKTVLNNWKVESLIGKGSFGSVYKISKEEYGVTSYSALKVLSVPQSDSDLRAIMNEGMDENSVTSYFEGVVNDIVREISIMSQFKGHPNIVGCEDHQVIAKEGTVGWDILIKMELLSSLVDYQIGNGFTISQTVAMGIELTDALVLCHSKGLIHRDIKPDNIFVNEFGVFKLGDFGVARNVENAMSVKSKKGTEVYMAPEVYMGKTYDASVDLYSLGIVLYKCLNNNRLPFLPDAGQAIKTGDREAALIKRMEGTPIPRPVHGDDELVRIILKSIAFEPSERYQTAQDMLNDLRAYMDTHKDQLNNVILAPASTSSSIPVNSAHNSINVTSAYTGIAHTSASMTSVESSNSMEKTVGVAAPIPESNFVAPAVSYNEVDTSKKAKRSGKKGAIIAAIIAAVALIGGGIFLFVSGILGTKKDDHAQEKVIEAANKYAEVLLKQDSKNIANLSSDTKKDDIADVLNYYSLYGDDKAEAFKAIVDSTEFEVDEDSFEKGKGGTASIDVVFTMPDYDKAAVDVSKKDDFIKALKSVDAQEVTVTIEFIKDDDGNWLVSNTSDVMDDVFAFTNMDLYFGYTAEDISVASYWIGDSWKSDIDGDYQNCDYIDYQLYINDCMDYEIYYTVTMDGQLLYTSLPGKVDTYSGYSCTYSVEQGAALDNGYLADGEYTISIYDANTDKEIYAVTAIVNYLSPADVTTFEWNSPSGEEADGTAYYEDVISIGFNCGCDLEFDYDGYFTVSLDGELLYTSEIKSMWAGYFYFAHYVDDAFVNEPNGYLVAGEYTVDVYTEDGSFVLSESCIVYNSYASEDDGPETSDDYMTVYYDGASDFSNYIRFAGWAYSDGHLHDGIVYEEDYTEYVDYDLNLTDDADLTKTIYYVMYYSENENPTWTDDYEIVDSGNTAPNEGDYCYYYRFNFGQNAKSGFYWVYIYEDESCAVPYMMARCQVK